MLFTKEQLVRFEHCDAAGIVFYPRFFTMLNGLVEDWFRESLNFPFEEMHNNSGIPTVDIKTQFKSPAKMGQILTKSLWIKKLGDSSCTYEYHFKVDERIVLEGEGTIVFVNLTAKGIKPKNWGELRSKMEPFLR
ncbi:acyl-CoA thioesterase [Tenacibaculum sp. UWU-22]|uniref:acyl-CoA thioesterase n=1 Tax=Tenacibaculum sp. UWU-22 TaxID=3234187 RepID=UPI0034DAC4D1